MTSSYPFLTDEQVERLVANGRASRAHQARDELFDPPPVVKLFTPDAGATWLLTEIDPDEPSMAFGLCGAPHKPNYVKHTVMRSAACQCSHDVVTGRHYSA